MKFYFCELKKFFRSPLCLVLSGVLLLAMLAFLCYAAASEPVSPDERTIYAVTDQRSYALQSERVSEDIAQIERMIALYRGDRSTDDGLIASLERQKKELLRTANVLKLFEAGKTEFAETETFPFFLPPADLKNPSAALLFLLSLCGGVCSLALTARTAWRLPSEQQNGQSKFTMLLPCGRTGYCLKRFLSDLLCAALFTVLLTGVCAGLVLCFLGGRGTVIAATPNSAIAAEFPCAVLLGAAALSSPCSYIF